MTIFISNFLRATPPGVLIVHTFSPFHYVILNRGLYSLAAPRKVLIRGLIKRFQDLLRFM